ncbi:hypothetical protein ABIB94_009193 [Bradyrhizobium sp. JR7.2]
MNMARPLDFASVQQAKVRWEERGKMAAAQVSGGLGQSMEE